MKERIRLAIETAIKEKEAGELSDDVNIESTLKTICDIFNGGHMTTTTTPKHTPGPWTLSKEIDGHGRQMVYSPGLIPVCIIETNEEANARLIAAAPELLEACKKCLAEFNGRTPNLSTEPVTYETWMMLKTGITKAEATQ